MEHEHDDDDEEEHGGGAGGGADGAGGAGAGDADGGAARRASEIARSMSAPAMAERISQLEVIEGFRNDAARKDRSSSQRREIVV